MGSPSVGKGTYTQGLLEIFDLVHVSSGDLFRDNIKQETDLGKEAQKYIKEGKLVPDEITIGMVKERLGQEDVKEKGFVLDGFPRTVKQAEALAAITDLDMAINFKANDEVIIGRISGRIICRGCNRIYHKVNIKPKKEGICDMCGGEIYQRDDDKPEAAKKRLESYKEQVGPLIDYYEKRGLLREITVNEEFATHKKAIMERILKVIRA